MTRQKRWRRGAAATAGSAALVAATLLTPGGPSASAELPLYALPACYGLDTPPVERPAQAQFQTCADGSKELTALTWTGWGEGGADGTGTYSYQVCEPNCAAGYRASFPAVVHADEPLAPPPGSGCPANALFFANLVVAFPGAVPGPDGGQPNMRFRGMPAVLYSTAAAPDSPTSLGAPSC